MTSESDSGLVDGPREVAIHDGVSFGGGYGYYRWVRGPVSERVGARSTSIRWRLEVKHGAEMACLQCGGRGFEVLIPSKRCRACKGTGR